jgi:hypothetical protein
MTTTTSRTILSGRWGYGFWGIMALYALAQELLMRGEWAAMGSMGRTGVGVSMKR